MKSSIAKKILHMCKIVYYMIRKGVISKQKLMMDLHLLLKRGKIAGRAIGSLMTFNHHGHHPESARASSSSSSSFSSLSCKSMNPTQSFYNPQEVEFSCSSTPSYAAFHTGTHRRHKNGRKKYCNYDYELTISAIAKAFDMLNNNEMSDAEESVAPSVAPSPMILGFGRSPRMVRQLRITDSPFPIKEDEVSDGGKVDREAEEFIRRFYEQLRIQQSTAAVETPEYMFRRG